MKLDDLKKLVAEAFDKAETKEQIEKMALINKTIDEVATEQEGLKKENQELLKSYKDVVLHTAVKPQPSDAANNPVAGEQTGFEGFLESWTSTHNEDGTNK